MKTIRQVKIVMNDDYEDGKKECLKNIFAGAVATGGGQQTTIYHTISAKNTNHHYHHHQTLCTSNVNHGIQRRRPTQHTASWPRQDAVVQLRLRLGEIEPIVLVVGEIVGQCGWDLDFPRVDAALVVVALCCESGKGWGVIVLPFLCLNSHQALLFHKYTHTHTLSPCVVLSQLF